MDWLTRAIVALLRHSEPMLPTDHRAWAHALRTEADEVPAGWDRLAWLSGGVRFTVREAALSRGLGYRLAFAAAAAATAWSAWSGPAGDSAIIINRVDVITILVILAGLPWAVRRVRGSVAAGRQARMIRTAGYAVILVLVLVKAAVERVADAPPNNLDATARAWAGEIAFLAVMACYAAVILVYTASRTPVVPAGVAIGTATGAAVGVLVYVLGPLGFPLRFTGWWPAHLYDAAMALGALLALFAPVAAGIVATRRADGSMPDRSGAWRGAVAGLWTGTAAALVVAALSTGTIALLPYAAELRNWAAGHVGQWTPVIGQVTPVVGPRFGYVAGNSAFAAGYLFLLLLSPLVGCGLGAWAGRLVGGAEPSDPPRVIRGPARESLARTSPWFRYRADGRHLRYGQPLLGPIARLRAGILLTCCAILVAVLGMLFAHQTTPDRFDHAIDAPVINWLERDPGLGVWFAFPGSLRPAVTLTVVIAVGCLLIRRLNGAVLAALAVPATVAVNDGLCKPAFHRTYLGVLSYPSGHTATMFALATTVMVLLYPTPRPVRARALRILIPAATFLLGAATALGVIGLRFHYFTDTVAGAAVGTGTVCGLALLLDLPGRLRRPSGTGARAGS
jgi:membrane-associated phospholipid phosphatase